MFLKHFYLFKGCYTVQTISTVLSTNSSPLHWYQHNAVWFNKSKLICIGKKGNYLTPSADVVTLNLLSRSIILHIRLRMRSACVCALLFLYLQVFLGKKGGKRQKIGMCCGWAVTQIRQWHLRPLRGCSGTRYCCYCSAATRQTKNHLFYFSVEYAFQ